MARYLYVKNGFVTNIVEHPTPPPLETASGDTIVPDLTGTLVIGSPFDLTDELKERRLTAFEVVILQELLRINNLIRVMQSQSTFTTQQYKNFLKGTM